MEGILQSSSPQLPTAPVSLQSVLGATGANPNLEGVHDPGVEGHASLLSVGRPQRHSNGGLDGASVLRRAMPAGRWTCQQTPLTLEDPGEVCREGEIGRSLFPRPPHEPSFGHAHQPGLSDPRPRRLD